ncbi:uncharacterized protein LOC135206392 [Macrobrachium nipponense]|uniref:uncharacterized protein LOC135206392 n=1 Tax=Macrobrachium nipponense TaxID=159736 RepID=UPI0030C7D07D
MSVNDSSKLFLEPLDSEVLTRTPWSCCPSVNETADAAVCMKSRFERTGSLNQWRRKQPKRKAKAEAAKKIRHLMRTPSPFPAVARNLRVQLHRCAKDIAMIKMKPQRRFRKQGVVKDNIIDHLPPHEARKLLRDAKYVGEGAFGKVYKVRYKGQTAAFKVGRMFGANERFENEAKILMELNGAGGAPAPLAITRNPPGIIMEFCSGVTYLKILASPDINTYNKLRVLPVAAKMLHEIHLKGIVHNDVKDDNIMVELRGEDQTPRVRIIDFGISCNMTDCFGNRHSPASDVRLFGFMICSLNIGLRIDIPDEFVRIGEAARRVKGRANMLKIIRDLEWALFLLKRRDDLHT